VELKEENSERWKGVINDVLFDAHSSELKGKIFGGEKGGIKMQLSALLSDG